MTAQRVAIVTGGLSGIGAAVVRTLEAAGCTVAAASRSGGFAPLDVRDTKSVSAFVDKVRADLGVPTILVNSAGVYRGTPIDEQTDEDLSLIHI